MSLKINSRTCIIESDGEFEEHKFASCGCLQGGRVRIRVLGATPAGGHGEASVHKVRISQNGVWSAAGPAIPVIIPEL